MVADEFTEPQQRVHRVRVADLVLLEERRRVVVRTSHALTKIECALLEIDPFDRRDRRRLLATRLVGGVLLREFRVLRRE